MRRKKHVRTCREPVSNPAHAKGHAPPKSLRGFAFGATVLWCAGDDGDCSLAQTHAGDQRRWIPGAWPRSGTRSCNAGVAVARHHHQCTTKPLLRPVAPRHTSHAPASGHRKKDGPAAHPRGAPTAALARRCTKHPMMWLNGHGESASTAPPGTWSWPGTPGQDGEGGRNSLPPCCNYETACARAKSYASRPDFDQPGGEAARRGGCLPSVR